MSGFPMNIVAQLGKSRAYVNVWIGIDRKIAQVRDFSVNSPCPEIYDGVILFSPRFRDEHGNPKKYRFLQGLKSIVVGEDINTVIERLLLEYPGFKDYSLYLASP